MESWVNAGAARQANSGHKDWHQHLLTSRFGAASLPEIQLVDMRLSRPPRGRWLSAELQEALKQTLSAGEQSLLFLNRRGYAPVTLCSSCSHRLACHQWIPCWLRTGWPGAFSAIFVASASPCLGNVLTVKSLIACVP